MCSGDQAGSRLSPMKIEDTLPPFTQARAFAVHVFTASGAALALAALIYAVQGKWPAMFACLGVALIVDGVDGTIARRFKVAEVLPRWSGDVLDLVVDFVTYVFVPAYAIVASGLLPPPLALPAGIVIVVTGALYFADRNMKTADNYFCGFPALWNAAAFYLFLLKPTAFARCGDHRPPRGADLRAIQVPPSDARRTNAGIQHRCRDPVGHARRSSPFGAISIQDHGSQAAWWSIGLYFVSVGFTEKR